jgi:hypothetical protein
MQLSLLGHQLDIPMYQIDRDIFKAMSDNDAPNLGIWRKIERRRQPSKKLQRKCGCK